MTRRQLPRATAAQLDAATFLPGEVAVDTTNDELRYDGDGSTVGGIALARKDGSNLTASASSVTATGGGTETLAEWFKGMARGTTIPTDGYFYFTNRSTNGNVADPLRMRHRLFLGDGCDDDGSTGGLGQETWLGTVFSNYFARSAQLLSISPSGGAGGVFATRTSDCFDGNPVWAQGQVVVIGDKRGYQGGLYTAATSGTTGATPPTHTTGTVSDGGVDWTFTYFRLRTPMAVAAVTYNDAADNGSAWGFYLEAVRGAGAGNTLACEIDIQNAGSNVNINPYAMFPTGLTPALWLTCQNNVYGPAATNPATVAIGIIGRAGEVNYKFNKGIVFHSESLTDEGGSIYRSLDLFTGCHITQYISGGGIGSAISFAATASDERVSVNLANRAIQFLCQGAIMGAFESNPLAGTAPNNYIALAARTALTGPPFIAARGTATDIALRLLSKGAASIEATRQDSSTNTAPTALTVRRESTGTPATGIGGALAFEVETGVSNFEVGALISAITTDVTSTSEDFDLVFSTMAAGAAAAERARFKSTGQFDLPSGAAIRINGTQVVAAQGAAVADAAGGATVDAEARTAINTLLARMRPAGHGLIAA